MAQRCSYCGRTEKQHNGGVCDLTGFELALKQRKDDAEIKEALKLRELLDKGSPEVVT